MKIIKEFKEFAVKGNMFDMAIGIIIGTAFSKIVNSLVGDLMMPLFSFFTGTINFQDLSVVLRDSYVIDGITKPSIVLKYGLFIQHTIDFTIIAITIFMVIKAINRLRTKSEDETNPTEVTPKNIQLLAEIRDLLKEQNRS
ncbi:large-conductance mechanosensitive channel protein MscL [Psychroflexus montanilacus]|uniref:large-conductance mechanosensitive channel protein MscL n=1 Tax=Psychroflexus montanilacus TaxID=2873598 RepID=UPI001CCF62F0|nr:large-conductance mechanosensitive channel protein MscL [Psychroflexus montanilacus]MBZ9651688.1 large-conductance mechanosensitive channel protein MscL [Psychroflexus montanilacus]